VPEISPRLATRRHLLKAVGVGALLSSCRAALVGAQSTATDFSPLTLTRLRGSVFQISGAGGNVVVVRTADGLMVVDSGAAERAQGLVSLLAEQFEKMPLRILFNTHWHLDHTGGNDALIQDGVTAISHESTRLWMSTTFFEEWENRHYRPRSPSARPNKTFVSSDAQPLKVDLGGEQASYAHLPQAHTDGDIYVAFPNHDLIVAGGVVTAGEYPIVDFITGGWIGGMADATKQLLKMAGPDTLIVPDKGPAQRRSDLEAQLAMLETIRERIEKFALQGFGVDDMLREGITADFDARYSGDAALFISNSYEGIWWNRIRGIGA
jgi:glyoxylase-like metal-dependent hydrolase (beta-lactamase superfamily II)